MANVNENDVSHLPIGNQLKLWRELQDLSQNQLVEHSKGELSKGGISRIETGDRYPTLTTLELVATHLSCTIVIEANRTYIVELAEALNPKPKATKPRTERVTRAAPVRGTSQRSKR